MRASAKLVPLLLAGAASLGLRAPERPEAPVRWLPAPAHGRQADSRLSLAGDRAVFRDEGVLLEVELLDDERRALFLQSAGLEGGDPLVPKPWEVGFYTFLVRVENRGESALHLRPQNIFFITRRPLSQVTPCDFACLYSIADRAGYDTEHRERLLHAALADSVALEPGGRISKLLVFTRVPVKFKDFALEFGAIDGADRQHRFRLPYGRLK